MAAVAELERLSPHTDFNDTRMRPLLKETIFHFPFLAWTSRFVASYPNEGGSLFSKDVVVAFFLDWFRID